MRPTWPVMSLLGPLGLAGLLQVAAAWRATQTPAPWAFLAVAPALLLPWLPLDRRTEMDPSLCAYQKGDLLYMEKKYPEAQAAYVARWASGNALQRKVFGALKQVVSIAYWSDARAWAPIGYDGPITARAQIPRLGAAPLPEA
jgi:hypothetical protein